LSFGEDERRFAHSHEESVCKACVDLRTSQLLGIDWKSPDMWADTTTRWRKDREGTPGGCYRMVITWYEGDAMLRNYLLSFGSRESRKPSPSRLNPNTVNMMARPGKITMWGAVNME
jgi:hypothetical protein